MAATARQTTRADGAVVLRTSRDQQLAVLTQFVVMVVPLGWLVIHSRGGMRPDLVWGWVGLMLVCLALLAIPVLRREVVLSADALATRNMGRMKRWSAADIQAVTADGTSALQVYTADGRVHTLLALTKADGSVVGDWWLAHRGAGWQSAWRGPEDAPADIAWWA